MEKLHLLLNQKCQKCLHEIHMPAYLICQEALLGTSLAATCKAARFKFIMCYVGTYLATYILRTYALLAGRAGITDSRPMLVRGSAVEPGE